MKTFLLIFCLCLSAFGGAKEDLQNLRNDTHLELTKLRLKIIAGDGDLKILHDSILRTHQRLNDLLAKHPQIADKKIPEPELSILKLKLLNEDEDLIEVKLDLLSMHRKLETKLQKNSSIIELTEKLKRLDERIARSQ